MIATTNDPKERPILFSDAMVRPILVGWKTQTRRVMRLHLNDSGHFLHADNPILAHKQIVEWREQDGVWFALAGYTTVAWAKCPYGQVGDRLWVREAWGLFRDERDMVVACARGIPKDRTAWNLKYRADNENLPGGAWRPSIHMPRRASRITLEITGIRVERVQQISEADAIAEGVPGVEHYRCLWDSLRPRIGETWGHNPWVWVIEFRRVEGGEGGK